MLERSDITALLEAHAGGDRRAFDQAVALVYPELRRVARGQRRGSPPGATLDTTAIVHEAYLKLIRGAQPDWQSRGHFLAVAATAMRQVAVDHVRARRRTKRGGDRARVDLEEATVAEQRQMDEILAVHDALEKLATADPRLVRVVECRYFAGMSEPETAKALDLSLSSVQRAWRTAKRTLRKGLEDSSERSSAE